MNTLHAEIAAKVQQHVKQGQLKLAMLDTKSAAYHRSFAATLQSFNLLTQSAPDNGALLWALAGYEHAMLKAHPSLSHNNIGTQELQGIQDACQLIRDMLG